MKVRIRGIIVEDVTLDDLDDLIERYGGDVQATAGGEGAVVEKSNRSGGGSGINPPDAVLLRKFVDASPAGVRTGEVGLMLGRKGKAIRPAAREWALRIGLIRSDADDPFEDCRVGTQRGIKIHEHLMATAKELAKR